MPQCVQNVHTERVLERVVHTCSGPAAGSCRRTGGFRGTPSRSDSDRTTESADSRLNPTGSDLTAAGARQTDRQKETQVKQVTRCTVDHRPGGVEVKGADHEGQHSFSHSPSLSPYFLSHLCRNLY